MEHTKRHNLDAAVAVIKQRFGLHIVHTLGEAEAVVTLSTGFAKLDAALGIGGIPRGYITELIGAPTSGVHTLASKLIASAHQAGDMAVYLDMIHTFDPDYTVVMERGAGVIVFDESLFKASTRVSFTPLLHTLAGSGCILLRLATWGSQSAAVRLHLTRERWLGQRRDVSGYRTRVHILKNKFAPPAAEVGLTIGFRGVVNGDGV